MFAWGGELQAVAYGDDSSTHVMGQFAHAPRQSRTRLVSQVSIDALGGGSPGRGLGPAISSCVLRSLALVDPIDLIDLFC